MDWNLLSKTLRFTYLYYMTFLHFWDLVSSNFSQRQSWYFIFLAGSSDIFFANYSLAATMGFSTTITLLLASYVTWFWHLLDYITTWILERRGSLLQFYVLSMLAMLVSQQWCVLICYLTLYVIRCNWWTILAHNWVVLGCHRRLHHRAGHDDRRWSLCVLVLTGSWLRWLFDDFGVG